MPLSDVLFTLSRPIQDWIFIHYLLREFVPSFQGPSWDSPLVKRIPYKQCKLTIQRTSDGHKNNTKQAIEQSKAIYKTLVGLKVISRWQYNSVHSFVAVSLHREAFHDDEAKGHWSSVCSLCLGFWCRGWFLRNSRLRAHTPLRVFGLVLITRPYVELGF